MENEKKIEDKIEEVGEEKVEATSEEQVVEHEEVKKEKKCCKIGLCKIKKCKNKGLVLALLVLILMVLGSYAFSQNRQKNDVGSKVIKEKVEKFVSENVPEGTKTEVLEPTIDGQLYKAIVKLDGQEIPVYLTKDGKKLIQAQGVVELDKQPTEKKQAEAPEKAEAEQKTDVPTVDLFVMSYCPYGTQIEKGMLPVLDKLGNKIKFNLRFVDYAMHADIEIDENLRQYCIQKTQQPKLDNYLKCFLKKGQGTEEACMKTAGVNIAQVNSCVSETDKQFNIKADAKDKSKYKGTFPSFNVDKEDNEKFGVQGSPTLVINGTKVASGRDSASLLKAVCSGFTNQPKECETKLSAESPAPGFGEGTAAASGGAGAACGAQ